MFIIHITKTHLIFSYMKSLLIFIASFSIAINAYAAEKSSGPEDMPETFKSGDAAKGSSLVASCAACHGSDGNSVNTDWPKLAGQNEKYLYDQLKHFKYEERNNALMMTVTPYLKTLSEKDLLDIASYYASNEVSIGQAKNDEDLLNLGMMLYRAGNMKKEIPACSSCHSVYGDGNTLAGYPSLAGQQIGYLTSTLKSYRSKERNEGEGALVMQSIAENLSDDEIEALSNYIHGIYK